MTYLDNAATTTVHPLILEEYQQIARVYFANPASPHILGQETMALLEKSRKQVLDLLRLPHHRLIFTSGATESNNMFLKGAFLSYKNRGKKIITSEGEHPSVRATLYQLRDYYGAEVVEIPLLPNGKVDKDKFLSAVDNNTIICSLIAVNNESGAINDIEEIAKELKKYPKCLFHVDATQALGKVKINYENVDALTFSMHKIHGLKGSGGLVLRQSITLVPLLSGGKQEYNLRAGTVNFPADYLMPKTIKLAFEAYDKNIERIRENRAKFMSFLQNRDELILNSTMDGSPFIVNFSLKYHKASVVVEALALKGVSVGTSSACSSRLQNDSAVIFAMTHDHHLAANSIRISMMYETTSEDIDTFINVFKEVLSEVKHD